MKINFNTPILGLTGEAIEQDGKPVTFHTFIAKGMADSNAQLEPTVKEQYAVLALKIIKGEEEDFSIEELKLVKDFGATFFTPLGYKRLIEVIEG